VGVAHETDAAKTALASASSIDLRAGFLVQPASTLHLESAL
jgi:hypothetical protein